MKTVTLKPERDKSLHRHHPWIFSGAIDRVSPAVAPGETVRVMSADGAPLAVGSVSPQSQIRVRVWSFDPEEEIAARFFANRLDRALQSRRLLWAGNAPSALRLVNAESDGLPGLIVDRYADFLVCQFLSAGAERWKTEMVRQLADLVPVTGIYERSEGEGRLKEGLAPSIGVLMGAEPPERIEIREDALRLLVDVRHGHKTGYYLDQRENRARVAPFSAGADVLNCFAYTGGFGLQALKAGAENLTNVETSPEALGILKCQLALNDLDTPAVENIGADVFQVLRSFRDARRSFDLIILDPPKFASSGRHVAKAARGYKDINLLAFKLIRPGGAVFTFSCSGHVGPALFQKIVADAALDAGRDVQVLEHLEQASDHMVALSFPEGAYLKGLICRIW
ncbi:MAG: class I SAM-dependent methyltransferase [Deltaproteobacteria bacterium]|nr:class I SAM-dependent methyltransferase [Deltaproteobacteria bacterium]